MPRLTATYVHFAGGVVINNGSRLVLMFSALAPHLQRTESN